MRTSDLKTFGALMMGIGALYGKTISRDLSKIYWQTLEIFEMEDVTRAFNAHINNPDFGQFFPKPADIVRLIEGSGETKALSAWTKVEKAIHQVGAYESVVFDDALIHAVLEDMGGWVKLCRMTNEQMPFAALEFQKRYMGFVLKHPNRYPSHLCGIFETENTKNGYAIDTPLLLGDASKAEEVLKTGGGVSLLQQSSNKALSAQILEICQTTFGKKKDES